MSIAIGLGMARRFQDLECWQLGRDLRRGVNQMLDGPAFVREFKLCDQMRDAARSVCSNMAEGFGKRSHPEFARYLDISIGSLNEIQNHLTECADRNLAPAAVTEALERLAQKTAAATTGLVVYLRNSPTPKVLPRKPRDTERS